MKLISWSDCILMLFIGSSIYYVGVSVIFYRRELKGLIKRCPVADWTSASIKQEFEKAEQETVPAATGIDQQVRALIEELQQVFEAGEQYHLTEQQLFKAMQTCLTKYVALKNTAFQMGISHHIIELMNRLNISVTTEEINTLW